MSWDLIFGFGDQIIKHHEQSIKTINQAVANNSDNTQSQFKDFYQNNHDSSSSVAYEHHDNMVLAGNSSCDYIDTYDKDQSEYVNKHLWIF